MAGLTMVSILSVYIFRKRSKNTGYMLRRVSDEGYETAHDVLFPHKSKRGKNLRYGPVLP